MRKGAGVIDSLAKRPGKLLWRLTVATTVLSLSVGAFGQDSKEGSSVDETFSSLHEALSATATDLLTEAQVPAGETPSRAVLANKEALAVATSVSVCEKAWPVNQHNQSITRLAVLRPVLGQILNEEDVPPELAGI